MSKLRPTYTEKFKQEAVKLFETSGKSKAQIARDLKIPSSTLSTWYKQFGYSGKGAFVEKDYETSIEEQNRELRQEIETLRQEVAILRKDYECLSITPSMKYQFIDEHHHLFSIGHMCRVLGVSESGYYNRNTRGESQRKQDDKRILEYVENIYTMSNGTYGSPRIHKELKKQGIHCGRKRIARLMREKGWNARKTFHHSESSHR